MSFEANIFGKGLDPTEHKKAQRSVDRFRAKGLEKFPEEKEKSQEFLFLIKKIEEYLNAELASFGLPPMEIEPDRIHLFDEEEMEKRYQTTDLNGQYSPLEDSIAIKDKGQRLQLYKSTLHESVHRAAYKTFSANQELKVIDVVRGGYTAGNPSDESGHEHFRGFDEAVVDGIVSEILEDHKQELIHTLNITEEERAQPVRYYREYMDILGIIMKKIAAAKNEKVEAVWENFKRGEFTGEMMHLRDVEEVFGKGSLRVLGALGSATKNSIKAGEAIAMIRRYFETDNSEDQERIARKVLIEREWLSYRAQRQKV